MRRRCLIDTVDMHDDGTVALIYNFDNCLSKPVKLIKILDAGHSYPGGEPDLPQWLVGRYTKEINASEEIWKFFKESME